jgi:hypothetical protein
MFLLVLTVLWGCEQPNRVIRYPDGALQVRYEAATSYSSCLVASVAMAANYLVGERRFSEPDMRQELSRAGLDETQVRDMKLYLDSRGLHLVALSGQLDEKPPTGLGFWLNQRGYPVICVINPHSDDPAFNHAVVVIGFSRQGGAEIADRIHYFDPSLTEPLHSCEAAEFDAYWGRGGHTMMIVVAPPPG